MTYDSKATNPKDAIGCKKLPMDLCPDTIPVFASLALLEGALKYGKFNWRIAGVRATIYIAAMRRHLSKFNNGEWADPQTMVPHLASVIACAGIILDAWLCDKLVDDRPPRHPLPEAIDKMAGIVTHLQEMFAEHDPHQNTIEDSIWVPENRLTSTIASTMLPQKRRSNVLPETKPDERPRQMDLFERETGRKSTTR